jgi:hypothetical protein
VLYNSFDEEYICNFAEINKAGGRSSVFIKCIIEMRFSFQTTVLSLSVLLLFSCSEKNRGAKEYLSQAGKAYQEGNYPLAKLKIDSIKILFPKSFDENQRRVRAYAGDYAWRKTGGILSIATRCLVKNTPSSMTSSAFSIMYAMSGTRSLESITPKHTPITLP